MADLGFHGDNNNEQAMSSRGSLDGENIGACVVIEALDLFHRSV